MHARHIGPLNLGAKLYVRKKSQIVFVGAGYRVLLAVTDSNQRPVNGPSRSLAAAASHTRRLRSERGICRSGSRGDEEQAGKTFGLPRFHIMHRPNLLSAEDRGACCQSRCRKAQASAHQYRLRSAEGGMITSTNPCPDPGPGLLRHDQGTGAANRKTARRGRDRLNLVLDAGFDHGLRVLQHREALACFTAFRMKKSGAGFGAGSYRYLVPICANWCCVENELKCMNICYLFDNMRGSAG